jgi:hypothetical protein
MPVLRYTVVPEMTYPYLHLLFMIIIEDQAAGAESQGQAQ